MRKKLNTVIVVLRTTEWKLVFKPFGYHKLLLALFGLFLTGSNSGFVIGLIIGIIMDCEIIFKEKHAKKTTDNRISYLMLAAFVLQAGELDGRISNETLHRRLVNKFGEAYATKRFAFFHELLRQRIQVEAICEQIKLHADLKDKKDIILFLFEISYHPTAPKEKATHTINYLAARINLPYEDVKTIYRTFSQQHQNNYSSNTKTYTEKTTPKSDIYTIFNLTSNCTEKELKTAFHHLAKKYHPDSNPNASNAEKITMQEKLRTIIESYDEIKVRRGWK